MVKRTYECMVLLDNREVKQGWQRVKDTVTGLFTKHGANVVSARLWDERRLAYPVKQQRRGTYLLIYFDAETQALAPLSRELEFSEAVLRHLVLACDEVPREAYEPEREFDVNAIGVEAEEPAVEAEEPAKTEEHAEPGSGEDSEGGPEGAEGAEDREPAAAGAEVDAARQAGEAGEDEPEGESEQTDEKGDRG